MRIATWLVVGLLVVSASAGAHAQPAPANNAPQATAYLFTYFVGNGEDGLHLAYSRDGYHWSALNPGHSYLRPEIGPHRLMRDPCLRQGPDGTFHMVWTTGWGDRIIGYASSRDLLQWSPQKAIPVMSHEPGARNAWAPELFYDDVKSQFLIFWSTTIPGRFPATDETGDRGLNHRIYYVTTKDFQTFSPTRLFFDDGFNCIDATLLKARGKYFLIVKDETAHPVKKHLRIATGDAAEGPFGKAAAPFTGDWVEGPSPLAIDDEFLVYFDHYTRPQYYGGVRSKDLVHWEDVSRQMTFPKGIRHGTAVRVPAQQLTALLRQAGSDESK
jgi:hypothetical protein